MSDTVPRVPEPGRSREPDTVVERARRAAASLNALRDPGSASVAVDGPCPNADCDHRSVVAVHSDLHRITCPACGGAWDLEGA